MKECLLIGGDRRHKYLAKLLVEQGVTVYCYNMDQCIHLPEKAIITHTIPQNIPLVILPIPITKDGETVFSTYTSTPVALDQLWSNFTPKQIICGGLFSQTAKDTLSQNGVPYYDYGIDDAFEQNNAIPSAEGAIELAMQNTPHTLNNASVCVVGYGKIGKALVKRLKALGCNVTATARKEADLQAIRSVNARAVQTNLLSEEEPFEILFNTVPALVVDEATLAKQKNTTLLIDLASKPGGIDFAYAQQRNMHCIHALSLPSICAPQTAAEYIWHSISHYLSAKEGE